MAFAPDYRSSGRFYIYYTDRRGFIQIDEYRRSSNPDRADPSSRRSVMTVPHFRSNHKGGQLQFGPDGMLYAGFGDGGSGGDPDENAQNLSRILGKLIRIDPRPGGGYSIPSVEPLRAPPRRPPRDLRLRAAQPLPLLVRPPARIADHRRRRPGRGRGDRLRPRPPGRTPAARRLQLRLGRVRGPRSLRGRPRARRDLPGDHAPSEHRLLLDHRRLRDPRPLPAREPLQRALRLRRSAAAPSCGSASSSARARPRGAPGCASPTWSPSEKTARAGSTLCRWTDRSTASGADDPARNAGRAGRGPRARRRGPGPGRDDHAERLEELLPPRRRPRARGHRLHARRPGQLRAGQREPRRPPGRRRRQPQLDADDRREQLQGRRHAHADRHRRHQPRAHGHGPVPRLRARGARHAQERGGGAQAAHQRDRLHDRQAPLRPHRAQAAQAQRVHRQAEGTLPHAQVAQAGTAGRDADRRLHGPVRHAGASTRRRPRSGSSSPSP